MSSEVKVGVGVFILKDNKILLGKRKGAHGQGCWSIPGGKLQFREFLEDCAVREIVEETGLCITNIRKGPYIDSFFEQEQQHWLSIFMIADYESGVPEIREPDKCEQWQWFEINNLPAPLFLPIQQLINHYQIEDNNQLLHLIRP